MFEEHLDVGGVDWRLGCGPGHADGCYALVGDGYEVVGGCHGGDFEDFGESAGPVEVGLDDVECFGVHEAFEAPTGVFVLGAGDWDVGLFADLAVGVDAVWHGDFFDPTGLVLFDGGCEFDDVVDVHGLPAVEHDVDLWSDGFAEGFDHLDVFDEAFM